MQPAGTRQGVSQVEKLITAKMTNGCHWFGLALIIFGQKMKVVDFQKTQLECEIWSPLEQKWPIYEQFLVS